MSSRVWLRPEVGQIEPVRSLRDSDEVNTIDDQAIGVGWRHTVVDSGMGRGMSDLFGGRIGCNDILKQPGQPLCCLAVSRCAVPSCSMVDACPRTPTKSDL